MENNSTDPEYIKKNFEALKDRFRIVGVGGIQIADGEKKYADHPEDLDKIYEQKKKGMIKKKGVVMFNPPVNKSNAVTARPRPNSKPVSSVKIFSLEGDKSKDSKEK